jgi:alkylhydroperoxidase/carboxymuconolactone decarboxylase family protein YurZ
MTQELTRDKSPSGASIRQRVFPDASAQQTAPGDPFLAPFFETAIEHVWGGVWNRPGLELKYRSLVVVSVLAATGHNEELKAHLRGALNLGWTVDELREALLQIGGYAGFSAAHEALDVLSDIVRSG